MTPYQDEKILYQDERILFVPTPQSAGDSMSEDSADSALDFEPSFKTVFKVTTPAIRWLWDWSKGYKVVLLGPSLAGKTRFLRYLYTLQLLDDDPTPLAQAKNRTLEVDNSNGLLVLRVGKTPGVLLRMRTVVDSPGLKEGAKHAEELVNSKDPRRRAHVIVLVLDGTKRSEMVQWIHEFASHLADILSQATKLCEIFVLINKYDKAKSYYEVLERAINDKLSTSLKPVIGERGNLIKLFPTILIRHEDAERLLDRVIEEIAFTLQRQPKALSSLGSTTG